VTAPLVLPPTVLGYYLLVALGRHGAIGHAFESLFGSSIVFTRTGAVIAAAVGALPLVTKSGRAALEGVDPTLIRAARTLGAGPARAFLRVQLPLAARDVVAALMLAFARALGDFGITLMVAGDIPGDTQTASLAIYDAIQEQRERAALGIVIALTATAVAILYTVNRLTAGVRVAKGHFATGGELPRLGSSRGAEIPPEQDSCELEGSGRTPLESNGINSAPAKLA
jgi:molybdate transport system permease protein